MCPVQPTAVSGLGATTRERGVGRVIVPEPGLELGMLEQIGDGIEVEVVAIRGEHAAIGGGELAQRGHHPDPQLGFLADVFDAEQDRRRDVEDGASRQEPHLAQAPAAEGAGLARLASPERGADAEFRPEKFLLVRALFDRRVGGFADGRGRIGNGMLGQASVS